MGGAEGGGGEGDEGRVWCWGLGEVILIFVQSLFLCNNKDTS